MTHDEWAAQLAEIWTKEEEINTLAYCLAITLQKMKIATEPFFAIEVYDRLEKRFPKFKQQDVHEAYLYMVQTITEEEKALQEAGSQACQETDTFMSFVSYKIKTTYQCNGCSDATSEVVDDVCMKFKWDEASSGDEDELNLDDESKEATMPNVGDYLLCFSAPEPVDQYQCQRQNEGRHSPCKTNSDIRKKKGKLEKKSKLNEDDAVVLGTVEANVRTEIFQLSPCLVLQLCRFTADQAKKISPVLFPAHMQIRSFQLDPGFGGTNPAELVHMQIGASLCHTGSGKSMKRGHYWVYIKNKSDGVWWKYDDSSAYKVSAESVFEDRVNCYMLFYYTPHENARNGTQPLVKAKRRLNHNIPQRPYDVFEGDRSDETNFSGGSEIRKTKSSKKKTKKVKRCNHSHEVGRNAVSEKTGPKASKHLNTPNKAAKPKIQGERKQNTSSQKLQQQQKSKKKSRGKIHGACAYKFCNSHGNTIRPCAASKCAQGLHHTCGIKLATAHSKLAIDDCETNDRVYCHEHVKAFQK